MEFLKESEMKLLKNPGVTSQQVLSPHNSSSQKVTITKVTIEPGATQERHSHEDAEQIWIATKGIGKLLLANGKEIGFEKGDRVRFEQNETHGLANENHDQFEYIAVTSPAINFDASYRSGKQVS